MNSENDKLRELCLSLMRADTEERVIQILRGAGYWDNPAVWRFYGDLENNFSIIGNQQSRPEAALVEKLVNSVDARLIKECLARGLKPEAQGAPQSIQEAVAKFFDNADKQETSLKGRIRDWPDSKRTKVARGIVLAATGAKPRNGGRPSFTIADCGEGQTPKQMPDTLLSLNQSNKLRIPFVQGKFNMGGTGVLEFCGKNNLQLVISRRSQDILNTSGMSDADDDKWGFTVVRREDPRDNRKSSVYTYLAPQNASKNPNQGEVLRFAAEEFPIFPEGREAYARNSRWGTLIKLYEYSAKGFSSHILRKDGLLSRVDLLLPDIALPMRFHECRSSYRGHEGSFETTLTGVRVRLEEDKGNNLESEFPTAAQMMVDGEPMLASIYAFKKGSSDAYRKNEGVIFVVNGQTHGHLTQDFFTRRKVGLSYLADSILVIVDCTKLSKRAREILFMNSRDRLRKGELSQQISARLEELLKQHQGLRKLRERRKREEIGSKLDDDKPLEDILGKLLKQSPTLSNLFMQGTRVSTPFKTIEAQAQERTFKGERFPTYFKFKGKDYGHKLHRECYSDMRCRLTFETDAENKYFVRSSEPGEFTLALVNGNEQFVVKDYVLNLQSGIASLSIPIYASYTPGSILNYVATTNDYGRVEPFKNKFQLTVKGAHKPISPNHKGKRRNPPGEDEGKDRDKPAGIAIPEVISVVEKDWKDYSPPFDEYTAMRIKHAGNGEGDDLDSDANSSADYDFYINMDNVFLKNELKTSKTQSDLKPAQFKYGMVLLGLAMLQQDIEAQNHKGSEEGQNGNDTDGVIEGRVEKVSRAIAPIIIPMIDSLGSLSLEDEPILDTSGEAT